MKVKVEGFKDLQKTLADLGKATSRNVGRRALRAALKPMVERAAQLAPELSGALETSIQDSTRKPKKHRRQMDVEAFMGPSNVPQAITQEFGTSKHSPQPYMRPAWNEGKGEALETVRDALSDEIMKAAKRAERKAARLARKAGS
ncbi:HK97-gp10 family putative phage morphogenesis protein [Brevundimonas sp. 3P9-tot-E]|uniref:HK97-gp10 family putative phage morphogenesis protein n=1 Tax=unclassified Brevundimonas TaxID=2622653 RepID=UPI00399F89AE